MWFTRNGLLTAALVVAALFIGSFVTERLPQPAQLLGETPFLHDGVVGAPVRLRVERQLGYKHAKYVAKVDAVASLDGVGRGQGGYWEDAVGYDWYAGI